MAQGAWAGGFEKLFVRRFKPERVLLRFWLVLHGKITARSSEKGGKGMCSASVEDGFWQSGEKLKAARIAPWVLCCNDDGKKIMRMRDGALFSSEKSTEHISLEWDGYVREMIHPEEQARIFAAMNPLFEGRNARYQAEYRLWNPHEKAWNWVFAYGTVDEAGPDGRALKISGAVQNINELMSHKFLRHSEATTNAAGTGALPTAVSTADATANELKKQRACLDAILAAAELGTWNWNIQTGEVIYNELWAEIAGRDLESIQGSVDAWTSAVLPEDLPKVMEAVEAHMRGETPLYEVEFRMYRGDGSIIWAVDRGKLVDWDDQGNALRLMGVLQDISASKMAQEELTRSSSQLEIIIREMNFGTWDWNPVTNVIRFNEAFIALLGYEAAEFKSTLDFWKALIHPDDTWHVERALAPLLAGETVEYECEMRIRHKDGYYIWTYDRGRAIEWDEDGRLTRVVGGYIDIDKRKEQEQHQMEALDTIALQKQVLERAVEERTSLLHRIRGRVNDILASTGYVPDSDASKGEEKVQGILAEDDFFLLNEEDTDSFGQELGNAFDLITEKMWWYKGIIDNIPFPIFVTDTEKSWTYLNAPALETIGADSLGEVLGLPAKQWGEDREVCPEETGSERWFSRYQPSRERYFQGQAAHLLDQQLRCIGHIEVMQDVTRIHEADQRIRIMLDSMPQVCNFWNEDFKLIDCNLASISLFRLSSKEEYLERFYDLSPERQPNGRQSKGLFQKKLMRAMEKGHACFEWVHRRPDGVLIPSEITLVRVENAGRRIVLSYTRDLTELKHKEAELDKERQLLVRIMANSPVCFLIFVKDEVRFSTPFADAFFGLKDGAKAADFCVDAGECSLFLNEVRASGSINWRVVSMRSAEGGVKEMLANAFLAEYYDEPCVMAWFLDVTEMRETERQLRLARDAAEESTRAKGEFLANMSHEIRTPMNAILGMTRLVLDTELNGRQRGYLEKAEQSARALLRILNDILDFSKIEAGRLEMEITDFCIAKVLQSVVDMLRDSAREKGLRLELSTELPASLCVLGDPLRLHQILTNLVSNAIKFTSKGGVFIRAAIQDVSQGSARFVFSVRDTGIGLEPEQHKRLFSAFSQADASTTRRYGGTGLGLAISKRLVELMQGEISCISEPGQGAEFSFTAVLAFSQDSETGLRQSMELQATSSVSGDSDPLTLVSHLKDKRILVAEDNDINQIVASEMLRKAGFIVEIAGNGREAIEMTLAKRYDLIFMDIQMPEVDGLTATKELRAYPHLKDIPIVAMTAHAMSGDKEKSLAVGMNDHITKPIDPLEVFSVISRWLTPENLVMPPSVAGGRVSDFEIPKHIITERTVTELPSSLPGVDVASGLVRVAGNKKLYVKLLRHVASDSPSTKEKLSAAIAAGDALQVRELAHSLKGAAANLSITAVAAASEKLETAAKEENFAVLPGFLDELSSALDAFVNVVTTLEGL